MAMHIPKTGLQTMMKDGAKYYSGLEEAVFRNITACKEMSQIVRTSFGPNGMNKMIVNHLDKLFVTNDAATIIRELEVEHPAAKMLILASQQQEHEVGDGTNLVMIFAGRLLEKAETLLKMGLSTAEVIDGFDMAVSKAREILPELVCHTVENLRNKEEATRAIKTALASKQYGYEDFLSTLVVQACLDVMPKDETRMSFNVDNVRVVKILGSGVLSSTVVRGMVFPGKASGTVMKMTNARVAVYSTAVDYAYTETKGTVLINSAEELKSFSKEEENLLEGQLQAIKDAGVNVIVTSGKVGDMALHFLNRMGILVLRVNSKYNLKRLCRTVGASALAQLETPKPKEIGACDEITTQEIGDTTVTVFRQQDEYSQVSTVVVRGSTPNVMDDIERAIDDGVNNFKVLTREQRFVPGAGATEMELASQLSSFADTHAGLAQYAIKAFAEALEIIPYTLAENTGLRATEVVSKLYSAHQEGKKNSGFNNEAVTEDESVLDSSEHNIIDNLKAKNWALTYATRAANTVLRVDQIIMAKKAGGPKPPKQNPNWDED